MHTHAHTRPHHHTHTITPAQDLRQFWTLFPHTPDNSFLGFVVEPVAMATDIEKKKNQGVLYGKEGTTAAWLVYVIAPPLSLLPKPPPSPSSSPLSFSSSSTLHKLQDIKASRDFEPVPLCCCLSLVPPPSSYSPSLLPLPPPLPSLSRLLCTWKRTLPQYYG